MPKPEKLSSGWKSFEVYEKQDVTPFSDTLATSGSIPKQAITKMRIMQDHGWPKATRIMKDNLGRSLVVKKDDVIWMLKCTPSCWRLYFYVWQNEIEKRIIFVHAVCKKADAEDPSGLATARRRADGIRPGGSRITAFDFPVS